MVLRKSLNHDINLPSALSLLRKLKKPLKQILKTAENLTFILKAYYSVIE